LLAPRLGRPGSQAPGPGRPEPKKLPLTLDDFRGTGIRNSKLKQLIHALDATAFDIKIFATICCFIETKVMIKIDLFFEIWKEFYFIKLTLPVPS
jgi:hypothetical protein